MTTKKKKTSQPEELGFDFDSLTYGEMDTFEEMAGGIPMPDGDGNLTYDGLHLTKVTKAMAFIAARRKDPEFTLEDLNKLKFGTFVINRGGGDVADPG